MKICVPANGRCLIISSLFFVQPPHPCTLASWLAWQEMASSLPRKSLLSPSGSRPINADKIMPFKTPSEGDPLLGRGSSPVDTFHLAYLIFFLHGVGHLLPWNFFITAQLVRPFKQLYTNPLC